MTANVSPTLPVPATPGPAVPAEGDANRTDTLPAKVFGLTTERLREIEQEAENARSQAAERLGVVYQSRLRTAPDDLLWLEVRELAFAALLLVGGSVLAIANLTGDDGERLAGEIRWHGEAEADVRYEEYDPPVRQRFTLGHELGHFVLHGELLRARGDAHGDTPQEDPDEDASGADCVDTGAESDTRARDREATADDPIWEREADAFAAAFLLPSRRLAHDVARFGRAVPFLSARYGVSALAMRRRLHALDALGLLPKG